MVRRPLVLLGGALADAVKDQLLADLSEMQKRLTSLETSLQVTHTHEQNYYHNLRLCDTIDLLARMFGEVRQCKLCQEAIVVFTATTDVKESLSIRSFAVTADTFMPHEETCAGLAGDDDE